MYPQERFVYHKRPFGLPFATKGLGDLAALSLPLLLLAHYKISCYQTTLLLTILALADINLLKTACHFLLLLVGFGTLTYQKELQLIPYTCGSSAIIHASRNTSWYANYANYIVAKFRPPSFTYQQKKRFFL